MAEREQLNLERVREALRRQHARGDEDEHDDEERDKRAAEDNGSDEDEDES